MARRFMGRVCLLGSLDNGHQVPKTKLISSRWTRSCNSEKTVLIPSLETCGPFPSGQEYRGWMSGKGIIVFCPIFKSEKVQILLCSPTPSTKCARLLALLK